MGLRSLARSVAHAIKRPPKGDLNQAVAAPNNPISPEFASTGVIRPAISTLPLTVTITPERMAHLIQGAATLGDTLTYFEAAEQLEEHDLHYRSLISTRKLAVAGLDIVVEPHDTSRKARKVAEFVETVLAADPVQTMLQDLLDGLSKGVSIVEIGWDTDGAQWVPATYDWRDPRWFDFSKVDGSTVMLRGPGGVLEELPPNRFLVHKPRLKTGLPVRSGLALPGAIAWCIKQAIVTDWAGFCETYGQPFRLGTFQRGTKKEDVLGLKKAIASLGADAYAVLPSDMAVQFIDGGGKNGNVQLFERFAQFMEDQQSRLVLGQTLTSGSGQTAGSYALGLVHNEVRMDILRSDAKQLGTTIMRDLVRPLVDFNFGADVPIPNVRFAADEGEDLVALATVLSLTVPLGIGAPVKWARDKFGIPAPDGDEETLSASQAASLGDNKAPIAKPAGSVSAPKGKGAKDVTG